MSVIFFSTSSILSSSITTAKQGEKRRDQRTWASTWVSDISLDARAQRETAGGGAPCERNSPSSAPSARGPFAAGLRTTPRAPRPGCVPARFGGKEAEPAQTPRPRRQRRVLAASPPTPSLTHPTPGSYSSARKVPGPPREGRRTRSLRA